MNEGDLGMRAGPAQRTGHGGIGIASFVLGLVSLTGFVVMMFIVISATVAAGGHMDPHSGVAIGSGLFLILVGILALVGTGLGIGGVMQRNRRRVFPILGLSFNGGVVLIAIAIILLGMAAK